MQFLFYFWRFCADKQSTGVRSCQWSTEKTAKTMKIIKIRKWTLIYCVELFIRDGEIFLRIFSRAKREFFLCESFRTDIHIKNETRLLMFLSYM